MFYGQPRILELSTDDQQLLQELYAILQQPYFVSSI